MVHLPDWLLQQNILLVALAFAVALAVDGQANWHVPPTWPLILLMGSCAWRCRSASSTTSALEGVTETGLVLALLQLVLVVLLKLMARPVMIPLKQEL